MSIETKVAWWKGENNAIDSVNAINGSWYNSYTGLPISGAYTTGVIGNAFSLGWFQCIRCEPATAINFSPTSYFYVQFYFKTPDVNTIGHLIGKGSRDATATAEWVISIFNKKIQIGTRGTSDPILQSSTLNISNDVWIKVKAIYAVGVWSVYVDDSLVLTGSLSVYNGLDWRSLGIGSDENGNFSSDRTIYIDEVEIYKIYDATPLFSIVKSGYIVSCVNESTGTITSYLWNFGDGTTSTLQNPVHTYSTFGTYTITLTVYVDSVSDNKSTTILLTPQSTLTPYSSSKSYTLFVDPKKIPQEFGSELIRTISSEQIIEEEEDG